ncbi:MAG: hypothetical protein GY719_09445 [bacterium]|nr:hypothetical protein [bacterium]
MLRAGVVNELHHRVTLARDRGEAADLAVVYFNQWQGDALSALARALREELRAVGASGAADETGRAESLETLLEGAERSFDGDLLILFDQFEEFFLYQHDWGPGSFAGQFADVVNRGNRPVSFLVALRDDSLSKLDRFKPLIPGLFDNYLRLGHLRREEAEEAIRKPVARYNRLPPEARQVAGEVSIEDELVEAVMDQVRAGRVLLGAMGEGRVAGEAAGGSQGCCGRAHH